MAKRISKFAQAQPLLADPQAIQLHKFGFIEFCCDPRPECIDVVNLTARRHGDRYDRVFGQIKSTGSGIDGGADRSRLWTDRCGDVIGGRPFHRGSKLVYVCQSQKDGRRPPRKFGVGPGAKRIEPFAIRFARRLRCGGDPHDKVTTFGLRQQLRCGLCVLSKTGKVDEHYARTSVQIEQMFRGIRRCRQRPDRAPYFLCQCI